PATVVASSSGMFQSIARLRSRMGTPPSTLTDPSGSGRTPGTAMSCSSEISPTISSTMSSRVTRPSSSPYSSTTSANGVLRWRFVGVEHHHLGAMDHHIRHGELAQIEQAAHHVAVEFLHDAGAMHQIDRAAQFLAWRQDRLDFADWHAYPV